jgi:hypothetical protein
MVGLLIDTAATITDEILHLHDRLIGSFLHQKRQEQERQEQALATLLRRRQGRVHRSGLWLCAIYLDSRSRHASPLAPTL